MSLSLATALVRGPEALNRDAFDPREGAAGAQRFDGAAQEVNKRVQQPMAVGSSEEADDSVLHASKGMTEIDPHRMLTCTRRQLALRLIGEQRGEVGGHDLGVKVLHDRVDR